MTVFLIIVSLYGGIARVPMNSEKACDVAAEKINGSVAKAYCIKNAP